MQAAVTFSLLAQLPVVLPELQDELGAEQLHVGVRGQHLRRPPVLDDSIGLDVQIPVHPWGMDRSDEESRVKGRRGALPATTPHSPGHADRHHRTPEANPQELTQWVGGELPAVYLQGTSPKSSALGFLGHWGSWALMGL